MEINNPYAANALDQPDLHCAWKKICHYAQDQADAFRCNWGWKVVRFDAGVKKRLTAN